MDGQGVVGRWRPLGLSLLAHAGGLVVLALGWWLLDSPAEPPRALAIEAFVVEPSAVPGMRSPAPVPARPAAAPEPPAPESPVKAVKDPEPDARRQATEQRKAAAEREAAEARKRAAEERRLADQVGLLKT